MSTTRTRWVTLAACVISLLLLNPVGIANASSNPPIKATKTQATSDSLLTPDGERAISDLRECLTSEDHLDVFYLIDASGSLFARSGQTGTDPDNVRSDLIANSLTELTGLRDDLEVNYALGFFGTNYELALPWRTVGADKSQESSILRDAIRNQGSLGWTNWKTAIDSAQQELAAQHKATGGCQLLVWLTDGGINIKGNNASLDDAALNDLCGAEIRPGTPPQNGYGAFNELRQAGVVVVGVLLRVPGGSGEARDSIYMPYMRPLIEGTGPIDGSPITCGEYPIPEGYASGALVEATSASDLARVFVDLGAIVSGGYASPFTSDGHFPVDPGIASFSIVTNSKAWTIQSPSGKSYSSESPGDAKVVTTSGVTRIDVETETKTAESWAWTSETPSEDGLYYFSDLMIKIADPETFLAGADNELKGQISLTGGREFNVFNYKFDLKLLAVTPDGREAIATDSVELDQTTGEFAFHYSAGTAAGVVTLEARLENLRTVPSGIPLSSISSKRDVTMTMPNQYPTITPLPLLLSDLIGTGGKAFAEWTVSAPADGSAGKVCFPKGLIPEVTSDSAKREKTWNWSISAKSECVEVSTGTKKLKVEVSNPIAANSKVSAVLPVEYVSAEGDRIPGTLSIEFSTTRPINAAAFGAWALVLMALGILGPLALLLFFNWLTHKISYGAQIQRASFAVQVRPDGEIVDLRGNPLRNTEFGTEHFQFQSAKPDAKVVSDAELGQLRARISLNPFGRPWFEIEPPAGKTIVGKSSPAPFLPLSRERLSQKGKLAGFNGDLGSAWGLVMQDGVLASRTTDSTPANANLVVYLRISGNDSSTMRLRMSEILHGTTISDRLNKARSLQLAAVAAKKVSKPTKPADSSLNQSATKTSDPPPSSARGSSVDAPPPSSSRRPGSQFSSPPSRNASGGFEPPARGTGNGGNSSPPDSPKSSPNQGDPPPSPWRSR